MSASSPVDSAAAPARNPEAYPSGVFQAHWFALFNAVAFQIMMGAPVILYAKALGASSTVLGVIAALTPLMTIFQLPAARFLDVYGYKRFVLMGWGLRTVFIFLIAVIPLLGFVDTTSKLALLMGALFVFNLLRGISSAAWLPWITLLVPEHIRGRFISNDQIFVHVGCLGALLASAWIMQGQVDDGEYALVFLLSAIGGFLSLIFIKRIPDIAPGEKMRHSAAPVPWRSMLAYVPFQRLLWFNLSFMVVLGGLGVFTVEYLREIPRFEPDTILFLSGLSFVGALLTLPFTGRLVDRLGSKPVLWVTISLFAGMVLGWGLLAGGVVPVTLFAVGALNFLSGIAGANFHLANSRLAMQTMPAMGRNHFFALFSVITSLGLGAAPVLWGASLDTLGTFELTTDWFTWRRHSTYFVLIFLCNLFVLLQIKRLQEKPGASQALDPDPVFNKIKRASRHWFN